MKKGGGAAKGSSFEREICKSLSLWWSNGKEDDLFWRTAGSGGRATNRAKKGKQTAASYGDISATDQRGEGLMRLCCFEIKRGYSWTLEDLLTCNARETLFRFFKQAMESTKQSGALYTALILKKDRKPTLIAIDWNLINRIAYKIAYKICTADADGKQGHDKHQTPCSFPVVPFFVFMNSPFSEGPNIENYTIMEFDKFLLWTKNRVDEIKKLIDWDRVEV